MTLCTPWLDLADETDAGYYCCNANDYAQGVLARQTLAASHMLYRASGEQYPGICEAVVRPCLGCGGAVQFLAYASGGSRPLPTSRLSPWRCSCGPGAVGACVAGGIALPGHPVREVTEVKVNGDVVTDWRLVRDAALGAVLLRVGGSWPAHQDMTLDDTEEGTWSVAYTYGNRPDPSGLAAVATLACELAMACNGDEDCRLPQRLQTLVRENVTATILDPGPDEGFGIREVDTWVANANPGRLQRSGRMFSPGTLG